MMKLSLLPVFAVLAAVVVAAQGMSADEACAYELECQPYETGYGVNCHYAPALGDCNCTVGVFADCALNKSALWSPLAGITVNARAESQQRPAAASFFAGMQHFLAVATRQGAGVYVSLLVVVVVVVYGLYGRLRDAPENNMRRARHYHRLAERAHERSDEEAARIYYQKAEEQRRRARA